MIIVIQCAASKKPDAGYMKQRDGSRVMFVADPAEAPTTESGVHARPDDFVYTGVTWRDELVRYNKEARDNPLGLLPAWQLYKNATYERLGNEIGLDHLYILSAGWGLIQASFLTPAYDITFSNSAIKYKKRRKKDSYKDFRMIPETDEPIVFFGGKDYVDLFRRLTDHVKGVRYIFYNSKQVPYVPGCVLKKYETKTRTNWHYQCANSFMDGAIGIH